MPTLAVTESQLIDAAGTLTDVYEITYQVQGHPGSFTFSVPKTGNAVADAQAARDALVAQVDALYGL
jgi:hypothetical protein